MLQSAASNQHFTPWSFQINMINQQFRISVLPSPISKSADQHFTPAQYVTLFLANLNPLPLSDFVTHPGTPHSQSTSHISDPPIFSRPSTKSRTKPVQILSQLFEGVFVRGFLSGSLLSGRFSPGRILSVPLLSEYICYKKS